MFLVAITASAEIVYETNTWVQTFVGSGFDGHVDGIGEETMFSTLRGVYFDTQTNLYVADYGNSKVRKITPEAAVSTLGDQWGNAIIYDMSGIVIVGNTAYIGQNTTISSLYVAAPSDDFVYAGGLNGFFDGQRNQARFYGISGITHSSENLFIADAYNRRVRSITNDFVGTFSGSGNFGQQDGTGVFCSFHTITAIAADSVGNIFVGDNHRIRKITPSRTVTTIAGWGDGYNDAPGTNASFGLIAGLCVDSSGNIIIADAGNHVIRKLKPSGEVTTIAGSQTGFQNGPSSVARFSTPRGVAVGPDGAIYVADSGNHRIRKVIYNPSETPVSPSNLTIASYPGLTITGSAGKAYRVESSQDMTNWTSSATFTLPSSPYLWFDTNTISGQKKFYRAALLP